MDVILYGIAAALFVYVLAGGLGGHWTVHRDKHHRRPRDDDDPSPLDFDDWER